MALQIQQCLSEAERDDEGRARSGPSNSSIAWTGNTRCYRVSLTWRLGTNPQIYYMWIHFIVGFMIVYQGQGREGEAF